MTHVLRFSLVTAMLLGGCRQSAATNAEPSGGAGEAHNGATPSAMAEAPAPAEVPAQAAAGRAAPTKAEAPPAPEDIPAPDDVAAAPAGAERTESGLASRVVTPGTGTDRPNGTARVTVHYTGWTTDGRMFDSSRRRGEPAAFPLNRVIPGWTEGVQLMVVGESRRFWIPAELAYGATPRRPGAPAGPLTFDIELVSFENGAEPPTVPADVAAAPSNAETTATGLASVVLSPGTGTDHPTPTSRVQVHYSGWTTDGHMFDSSVARGRPASFGVGGVIAGWTEGLQLMVVGEKRRFWIPADLAYGDTPSRPGAPVGMLVFDVELLAIQ